MGRRRVNGMARAMAKWIGWNFALIIAIFFVAQWNLKFVQAIVISFQTLVPSFTYWDLTLPIEMISFLGTFWLWCRPSALRHA